MVDFSAYFFVVGSFRSGSIVVKSSASASAMISHQMAILLDMFMLTKSHRSAVICHY